jgi:hypothetical protein
LGAGEIRDDFNARGGPGTGAELGTSGMGFGDVLAEFHEVNTETFGRRGILGFDWALDTHRHDTG